MLSVGLKVLIIALLVVKYSSCVLMRKNSLILYRLFEQLKNLGTHQLS